MKPLLITSKAVFDAVLRDALARTDALAGADPAWDLPANVKRQLELMRASIAGGRSPTKDEADQIDVGPLAVRNFEDSDDEYATWLKELDYAFRRYDQLP